MAARHAPGPRTRRQQLARQASASARPRHAQSDASPYSHNHRSGQIRRMTDTEHTVHEVVGPDLSARQAASALSFGVVSLLFAGVLPALLGALADEGRLSAAGFGRVASLEALSMGIATALAGILLPPRKLRLLGLIMTLALAALDFAALRAGEGTVLILRTL